MSAHEPTRLGKLLSLLLLVSLLLFGTILVLVFMNWGNAQWSIVLLSLNYPLSAVIWVLLAVHVTAIFLRREADGSDVLIGVAEAILLCCMTPEIFTAWQAFTKDPSLLFGLFREPLDFRFWVLARMVTFFVLLVKFVGPKWLKKETQPPLTLEDIQNITEDGSVE